MNSILQDILGLAKRRKIKTPSEKDYIVTAAYDNPQEALKPNPKMHSSLITIKSLKDYFLSSFKNYAFGGWAIYYDTQYTQTNPLTIINNKPAIVLPNNALNKIETQMNSLTSYYDGETNKITPVKVGDSYTMVVSFQAKTTNAAQNSLNISLSSTGTTSYERVSKTLIFTKSVEWENFYEAFKFYIDADFLENGNQWQIKAIGNNHVDIANVVYFIEKSYSAN